MFYDYITNSTPASRQMMNSWVRQSKIANASKTIIKNMPKQQLRRRTRRTRRTPRRTRRRTHRRRYGIRPDGMHKEKITIRSTLVNETDNGAWHNFHWLNQDPGQTISNTGIGTNNTQHDSFRGLYQFWMVYGMQIKFIPRIFGQSSSNTIATHSGYMGSIQSNTLDQEYEADVRNVKDYKPFDPTRPWTRYYRIGKYLKHTVKASWAPTMNSAGSPGVYNPSFAMKTFCYVNGSGFGNQPGLTNLGNFYVTYYVMYKNRKYHS